jgi:uncharacterized protein (DUF427 family)
VTLTKAGGPFSFRPHGTTVVVREREPQKVVHVEPSPKRIRLRRRGEVVADSVRALMVHETGNHPVYWLPQDDVAIPGESWDGDPRVGELLAGHVTFAWDAVDEWLEEDLVLHHHARNPYTRVEAIDSSRRVRVRAGGELVADSERAIAVFETGLQPRWYLPPEDVRMDLLTPHERVTHCPYKGAASYWAVPGAGGDGVAAWAYLDPLPDMEQIRGRICFYDELVEVEVADR